MFEINACDVTEGIDCADESTVLEFMHNNPVNVVYRDMFKDSSDAIEPIKYFTNDPY